MANLTAKIVVRYRNEQGQRKWIEANGKTDPQGTYYLQFSPETPRALGGGRLD